MKTRRRIKRGTLVASTSPLNRIKSTRFVINVYFDDSYRIIKSNVGNFRTCIAE